MATSGRQISQESPKMVKFIPLDNNLNSNAALLMVDSERYLLNCCEGIQHRLFHYRVKKAKNIFITSNEWKNTGGLPGITITLANTENNEDKTAAREDSKPKIYCSSKLTFNSLYGCAEEKIDVFASHTLVTDSNCIGFEKFTVHPIVSPESFHTSYYFKFNKKEISIDISKVMKLNLKNIALLRDLKKGISVIDNGVEIKPEDVSKPSTEISDILVVDVCNLENLKYLCQRWENDFKNDCKPTKLLIAHFTENSLAKSDEYLKAFNETFSHDKSMHIFMNSDSNFNSMPKHFILTLTISKVFPEFVKSDQGIEENFVDAIIDGLTESQLPKSPINLNQISSDDQSKFVESLCFKDDSKSMTNFPAVVKDFKTQIESLSKAHCDSKTFNNMPEISFIGTGSAVPSQSRNNSGILINQNSEYILLDCGERTWFNMNSFLSTSKVSEVLTGLKLIFISHLHLDHCIGIIGLLLARKKLIRDPVPIIAHPHVFQMINELSKSWNCDIIGQFQAIDASLNPGELPESLKSTISNIKNCRVKHIDSSLAIRLDFSNGFSLSYSGDTCFAKKFVELSKNVDMMICEATFENAMSQRAKETRHCTNSDALKMSAMSNAKFLILTHFSQRYDKMPVFENQIQIDGKTLTLDNFCIAIDNMCINRHNIHKANEFSRLLCNIFSTLAKKEIDGEFIMNEKLAYVS